jgi:ABC-type phosphate/phosphonate transport system permease subunit
MRDQKKWSAPTPVRTGLFFVRVIGCLKFAFLFAWFFVHIGACRGLDPRATNWSVKIRSLAHGSRPQRVVANLRGHNRYP